MITDLRFTPMNAMDHKPPKIKRTYDRHECLHEKQHAFKRLADHIDTSPTGPRGKA